MKTVSFPVNPEMPRLRLATAKRRGDEFVVDCLITDGGGIPRNVTVASGLCLVKLSALTMEEFVVKTSRNPARILGLVDKGHLGIGADADVSVVDIDRQKPVMSISNGKVIMFKGSGVQGYILVPGLHIGCVFTTKASASSGLIQNLEPIWQLFKGMSIVN